MSTPLPLGERHVLTNIQSATYNKQGLIDVVADQGTITIPVAPGNSHYAALQKWLTEDPGHTIQPVAASTLAEMISAQLIKINTEADRRANIYISTYPLFERQTWPNQEAEARAWLADNNYESARLTSLATYRGLTVEEIATRIINKVDLFNGVADQLMGQRQAMEDQLNALPPEATLADVKAIWWAD